MYKYLEKLVEEKQSSLKTNGQCIKKLPRIALDAFWLLYQDNIQTFYGVFLELLMMECYLFSWKYHMTEKVMSYSMPFFRLQKGSAENDLANMIL